MKTILKVLLTAVAVVVLAYLLPGVSVESFKYAILVAVVLGLLRLIVRPILVVLTFPITIVTLGLFLWVINAIIIMLADFLLDGFTVNGLWWALIFSFLLSVFQSILYSMLKKDKKA